MNRLSQDRRNDLCGKLLVATPALNGNQFEKTVVLVLQDNENGTFGVVLNRPANAETREAWESMTGRVAVERCIVHGGPIGGPVFAIHQDQAMAEVEMPGGLFVSADSELLRKLTEQENDRYRIVFGIASWSDGQLQTEIDQGVWFALNANPDVIFDDANWMWEKSLRQYGQQITCDVLGLSRLPADPNLN